ncbi:MAG: helix-turn-helix domain-containing protein [Candidatus Lokiarchaeota archaeon]
MIKFSIKSEDVIINALNHEIRREILRLLNNQEMGYTQLLDHFAISSGKLNYHIKLLGGFIEKTKEGDYAITNLGNRVLKLLGDFNHLISEGERPLLKKAYLSQVGKNKSFLHIRYIGGIYMKIILLTASILVKCGHFILC